MESSIKQVPPERMTPEQRRAEIAGLLAAGLARLREANAGTGKGELGLGFGGDESVHVTPSNEPGEESA